MTAFSQHQNAQPLKEIDILWITAGLGCDGESIAMTAATQPSIIFPSDSSSTCERTSSAGGQDVRAPHSRLSAHQKAKPARAPFDFVGTLTDHSLPHFSQTAFAILAITPSRVPSSAGESETNIAMATWRPFGSVMIPMSLVAAVIPF